MIKSTISIVLGIALFITIVPSARAQKAGGNDWPQFLGPDRTGISKEKGLIKTWPEGGLKELWRVPGGVGMGGVSIVADRAYALVQRQGKQSVIALNAVNGKLLWETPIADTFKNAMGNGPRTAPTVAGKMVYAYSGEGILAALDSTNGKVAWSRDIPRDHRGKPAEYGMASSPLLTENLVVVVAGCPKATVVAYDRKTGKPAWAYSQNDAAGYCSPTLMKLGGRPQIVSFSGAAAFGLNPRNGRAYWRYGFVTDYNCNIATPLLYKNGVFISAGENHGSALLSLKPAADGFSVTEKWKSFGRSSVMRNEWQTSVLIDGFLYGFDNKGSAGPISHLTCISAETGEKAWEKTRFGKGNLIAADGKLFMTTMKGELVVAKISSESYQELGRMELLEQTRQAPALSNGRLFLRDGREIVCVDVRAK